MAQIGAAVNSITAKLRLLLRVDTPTTLFGTDQANHPATGVGAGELAWLAAGLWRVARHDPALAAGVGAPPAPVEQTLLPPQPGDVLELDECWCYIQQHCFDRWLWTAMCRRTRQIVAYAIGDRTQATCLKLWHRLPLGDRDCPLITDGWVSYQLVPPPPQHVIHRCQRGPTNHAERWYNTLRQRLARYTCYTLSFSKDDTVHQLIVHAFIIHYNLAIQQASLTM